MIWSDGAAVSITKTVPAALRLLKVSKYTQRFDSNTTARRNTEAWLRGGAIRLMARRLLLAQLWVINMGR